MLMWRPQTLMGQERNQTRRDNTKLRPVFLMAFMMKMYVFTAVTQVTVNNSTFDELNHKRNNKTMTDIVSSLPVAVLLCFFWTSCSVWTVLVTSLVKHFMLLQLCYVLSFNIPIKYYNYFEKCLILAPF